MAAVLKRQEPASSRRIPADVFEATQRAMARLARAQEEASEIRARAEAEREAIRAQAEQVGRREALAWAAAALAGAALERDRILGAAQAEVVALAVDVARRVLARELSTGPGAVVDLAAAALEGARARRLVTLRVHPADAAAVRAGSARLASIVARAPGLSVEEDGSLAPGDVVVETEAGRIDARIETQLDALRAALEEALG
jgi:flagellar biosynthesis/type III secretory pathway protein FliH